MASEHFSKSDKDASGDREKVARTGALNVALIFGVAAIALTLIVTPFVVGNDKRAPKFAAADPYDNITTGSIQKTDGSKRYIVRRSLLQQTPGAVCIINSDGSSSGC